MTNPQPSPLLSPDPSRRAFLRGGVGLLGGMTLATPFHVLGARSALGEAPGARSPYGSLRPVKDDATGLELIKLPEGFRYVSMGWTGDPMTGGLPDAESDSGLTRTPSAHDGMAVTWAEGDHVILTRNHELRLLDGPTPVGAPSYDPNTGGGTSNLRFDLRDGRLVESWMSLSGTAVNCAGGPTPWGSWLTCEETIIGARTPGVTRNHGYIFEVPALQDATAQPLKAMGRFVHEAVAIDPETGIVYETEDSNPAGFYRFRPETPGTLQDGGTLQMLRVVGNPGADFRGLAQVGIPYPVDWVDIDDPDPDLEAGAAPVRVQGQDQGAAIFSRLEGCSAHDGQIYFISTSGGVDDQGQIGRGKGQIWRYDPVESQITCLYQSLRHEDLSNPDNMTVSPGGAIVLCEDGSFDGLRLIVLDADGRVYPLAQNNVRLNGQRNGISGDFTRREWAGATFSPDGRWLFANLQSPGITLAITGPWPKGPLG